MGSGWVVVEGVSRGRLGVGFWRQNSFMLAYAGLSAFAWDKDMCVHVRVCGGSGGGGGGGALTR